MNRGHVCAIRGAHSRTRDCDAVAKRFEFLPPPSSLSLSLSVLQPPVKPVVCARVHVVSFWT